MAPSKPLTGLRTGNEWRAGEIPKPATTPNKPAGTAKKRK